MCSLSKIVSDTTCYKLTVESDIDPLVVELSRVEREVLQTLVRVIFVRFSLRQRKNPVDIKRVKLVHFKVDPHILIIKLRSTGGSTEISGEFIDRGKT